MQRNTFFFYKKKVSASLIRYTTTKTEVTCHSAECNLLSVNSNPEVVSKYLAEAVALGWVLGLLTSQQVPAVHMSPFGVIPKGHTPGKWRLIVNLPSPDDGIPPEWCSLSHIEVDDVARHQNIGKVMEQSRVT